MTRKVRLALSLIEPKSRSAIILVAILRIVTSALDTFGVILIGILLAKSTNQVLQSAETGNFNFFSTSIRVNNLTLIELSLIALSVFLFKSIFSIILTKVLAELLAEAESKVATSTFDKILSSGNKIYPHISSQELIFALNYSATFAIAYTISISVTILSESMLLLTIGLLFIAVDAMIAFSIIVYFSILGYLIYKIIGPRMQEIGRQYAESAQGASTSLSDSVIAYREMLTLRKEEEFSKKFSKGRINFAKSNSFSTFYSGLPRYIVESALMVGAVLLALIVFANNEPAAAAGILGVFLTGSVRIMASMLPLQASLNTLRQTLAQSDPFFDLIKKLEQETLADFNQNQGFGSSVPPSVIFEHVSYRYPNSERLSINNVSLKIKSGEFVALIGPSGAGKSTIAELIIKLLEPESGKIIYEPQPFQELRVGYVPQSPGIVSGSILDNITLNLDSKIVDEKNLKDALEKSHLNGLIDSLKDGVNTDLGAQSDSLSGGQLQRIGLARAIYSQPQILILDEATSALDAETESAVTDSLNSLRGRCTIVVIAHRLSTVKDADCVYVIDDGQMIAFGRFGELAKSNELVARYVELSKLEFN